MKKRLLARNAILKNQDEIIFNPDSFIQRLLLFDEYILDSIRLKEIPYIIDLIGYDGCMELLEQDFFHIRLEAITIAQIQQLKTNFLGREVENFFKYSFDVIKSVERDYIHKRLKIIDEIKCIEKNEKKKLKLKIVDNIIKSPQNFGIQSLEQSKNDFLNSKNYISAIVETKLKELYNINIPKNEVILDIKDIDKQTIYIENNLAKKLKLNKLEIHKIIEGSLLTVEGLNLKFEQMMAFDTISGFKEDELLFFDIKTQHLLKRQETYNEINNFNRVMDIKRFPKLEFRNDIKIDIQKLINIRNCKDFVEFRKWLSTIDEFSDKDIEEQLNNYKSKLKNIAHTSAGGTLKWIVGKGVDLLPSSMAGYIYEAIDNFIIDKVLPKTGYISFIDNEFSSIYKI